MLYIAILTQQWHNIRLFKTYTMSLKIYGRTSNEIYDAIEVVTLRNINIY